MVVESAMKCELGNWYVAAGAREECCWLRGQDDEDESATKPVPPRYHDDQKHKRIGEQTNKEIVQNFLAGDFCVHGVSLWHILQ